ncbi:uncharacterized protein PADG_11809 [Paracoccidioides brasiliensis Pb18]|uniref:Uncharacterized protein n=2 Tax=Paracoccidioides brasiliensis TaxID=121759 RepID=A0A0A0HTP5_PARBD|nr:uncharacterized protein PADG_11809 [Paracoccidioides brasiliensis Pb18]KGM92022.1 hypothetical protein PADG_11809 [Paracoccidioides brasiliensis Pb18]ODH52718.1 hypothetical protein GX48_01207 [Paracoccidioides brasiliensis]
MSKFEESFRTQMKIWTLRIPGREKKNGQTKREYRNIDNKKVKLTLQHELVDQGYQSSEMQEILKMNAKRKGI